MILLRQRSHRADLPILIRLPSKVAARCSASPPCVVARTHLRCEREICRLCFGRSASVTADSGKADATSCLFEGIDMDADGRWPCDGLDEDDDASRWSCTSGRATVVLEEVDRVRPLSTPADRLAIRSPADRDRRHSDWSISPLLPGASSLAPSLSAVFTPP